MNIKSKHVLYTSAVCNLLTSSVFTAQTTYTVNVQTDSYPMTGGSGSGTSGDFRYVLNQIADNQAQGNTGSWNIEFDPSVSTVTLNAIPPMINLFAADPIVIGNASGPLVTIDGNQASRIFFCRQGDVTIQNIVVQNAVAQGGSGGQGTGGAGGGGGALGAGGGLFIDSATVTLNNVSFYSTSAVGGNGGASEVPSDSGAGGGGGGLGGNGGDAGNVDSSGGGGGGGYSGNGGAGGNSTYSADFDAIGGGGGGGGFANGGDAEFAATNTGGSGGGGGAILGANGGNGVGDSGVTVGAYVSGGGGGGGSSTLSTNGGDGGGASPGSGGSSNGGGGGGGGNGSTSGAAGTLSGQAAGGFGGVGGGGGGGGSSTLVDSITAPGGDGGTGGGGGGGAGSFLVIASGGGAGGYGGGGGGSNTNQVISGEGGYGGGGGASGETTGGAGGYGGGGGGGFGDGASGGFGGGGAGSGTGAVGVGGVGAGNGGEIQSGGYGGVGGGGAALGGAIFVSENGTLLVQGTCSTSLNTTTTGSGGNNGAAVGSDLFAQSTATLIFSPAEGETITFNGSIADDSLFSLPAGQSYQPGNGNGVSLIKRGAGVLILNNNVTCGGLTDVQMGELVLDGTISKDVSIQEEAILSGIGSIQGNLTIDGTVDLGHSIGTFTAGNTIFNSTSIYLVEINDVGDSDLLDVTGSVTINGGTLEITPDPGVYTGRMSYTIIEATNGITGAFGSIVNPFSNLNIVLVNTGNSLQMFLESLADFGALGLVGNPEAVGHTLDAIIASGDPALDSVLTSLNFLTREETSNALNQMQPALFKGLVISQENNVVMVRDTLGYRMQNVLDRKYCVATKKENKATLSCATENRDFYFWMDGFGDVLHQYATSYAASSQIGYHAKTGGAVIGLDHRFAGCFYAGALGGYTGSEIHWSKEEGKGTIDTAYGGLYFSALGKMFYANASVIGGWSHFHASRNIVYPGMNATAKNSHGGAQLLSHIDSGINFGLKNFIIRPYDSFDYVTQNEQNYQETGAGALNLRVKSSNAILLRNELGIQFSGCFCIQSGTWTLSPKISWVREVRTHGSHYTARFVNTNEAFSVTGYFPDRSLVSPGINISGILWKDRLGIDLYYNGEFAQKYQDNNFGGQIRLAF